MATDRTAKQAYFKRLIEDSSFTKSDPMSDRQREQLEACWQEMKEIYPEDYDAYPEPKKYSQPKEKKLIGKYQLIPSPQAFDEVRLDKWAAGYDDGEDPEEIAAAWQAGLTVEPPVRQKKDFSWAPIENLRGKKNLGVTWKKGLEVFSITTYSEEAEDLVLQTFYDQLEQHGWLLVRARVS